MRIISLFARRTYSVINDEHLLPDGLTFANSICKFIVNYARNGVVHCGEHTTSTECPERAGCRGGEGAQALPSQLVSLFCKPPYHRDY